jgi:hypothetical protein
MYYIGHLIVRANVQTDRKTVFRQDTTQSCVQRQLANGNAHAKRAQVAEAENTLSVCYHNCLLNIILHFCCNAHQNFNSIAQSRLYTKLDKPESKIITIN